MMATPLHLRTLLRVSAQIRRQEVSSVEVTTTLLNRIAKLDGIYHSYAAVLAERALEQAERTDKEIARGQWRGRLHGVPIAIKDLCFTSYAPTAAGTAIRKGWVPPYTATVVERLEQGGAIMLGKLKMTEGAYTSHHPSEEPPRNPWNKDYWVGSSSTGSGVATAARLCYGSLGSDTGGSIRFPSATCGLTGIKPTWGRVSRHGIFALAESMDHVGPMTRTAADAAAMLGVIAGADPNDSTTLQAPVPDYMAGIGQGIRGLRIGIDRPYTSNGINEEVVASVREAEAVLVSLGASIREVRFPPTEVLLRGWIPLCGVETAVAHKDTYPARAAEYGAELAGLIDQGRKVTSLELGEILHERLAFAEALATLFRDVDLLRHRQLDRLWAR